jgi:hypothetical protein
VAVCKLKQVRISSPFYIRHAALGVFCLAPERVAAAAHS